MSSFTQSNPHSPKESSKRIHHQRNVTPMILAGGLGTRLQSLTGDCPKVIAPVAGRPFLGYLLDKLSASGFSQVILCTGYMADKFQAAFGERYKNLDLIYSKENAPLGTGGALRHALPAVENQTILAMNGDSYVRADLTAYLDWFFTEEREAALVLVRVNDTSRYGRVETDRRHRVVRFTEKAADLGPGWINAGVYLFKKSLLASMPAGQPFSLEREFLPRLVEKGLWAFKSKGAFIDIGTPESYGQAKAFFQGSQ